MTDADVDAVCFDLDSTLCISEQSDHEIHDAVFDSVDVDPYFTPADLRAVDSASLPTAESDREFYEHLYRAAADHVDAEPNRVADLAAATLDVVDETAIQFRDGAREAVEYVREYYDVGLVTNGGAETQGAKLDVLGIADAFDVTVFCDPADGVEPKPDPRPFELALDGLDATPERTLFVGDSLGCDVAGAHAVGLQSAWVPPGRDHQSLPEDPEPAPTYRLESPAALTGLL